MVARKNDNQTGRIEAKLDTIIRPLALEAIAKDKTLQDRSARLRRVGMMPKEIADLCESTPNAVNVALSKAKTSKKKTKKEASDAEG